MNATTPTATGASRRPLGFAAAAIAVFVGIAAPAALATASPAAASGRWAGDVKLISTSYRLPGLQTKDNITLTCPADHQFLLDSDYSPSRILPYGVAVQEDGGVGATGLLQTFDYFGSTMGTGVRDLSITNWTTSDKDVAIVLRCSDNMADGFFPGQPAR